MYNPTQIIKINKEPLPDEILHRLISYRYEDCEKVDKLTLTFENRDLELLDSDVFQQGLIVEFRFGYIDDLSETKYFTISAIKGFKTITLECLEIITLFNTEPKLRVWENASLCTVVTEIAKDNNLKHEVQERKDAAGNTLTFTYIQPMIEDLAFLYTLSQYIGYEMWIEKDTLYFMPRSYWQSPYMEFTWLGLEGQILDINFSSHTMNRKGSFQAGGIDLEKNQSFFFTENGKTAVTTYLGGNMWAEEDMVKYYKEVKNASLVRVPSDTKEDCENILAGKYIKEMEDQITGDIHLIGEPNLKSKKVILINNVKKFSGKYYVKKVTHSFDGNGFVTVGSLSRNASFDKGEKYSRENIDSMVNKSRLSVSEFLETTKLSPLGGYYKELLGK